MTMQAPEESFQRFDRVRRKSSMLGDLKSPRLMYVKAGLFILLGLLACIGLLLEAPSLRVAFFLGVAIWAFARAYYFAFYVIEHYVDPHFRYAGLCAIMKSLAVRKRRSVVETD